MTFDPSCQCQLTTSSFDASGRLGDSSGTIFTVATEVLGKILSKDLDGSRSPFASGMEGSDTSAAIACGAAFPTWVTPTADRTANRPPIPARQNNASQTSLCIEARPF